MRVSDLLPWTGVYMLLLGTYVGVWRVLPGILERTNERQRDKAAAREADWKRLRDEVDRYSQELREVREHEKKCQQQLSEVERRLAKLEGYADGQGEARGAAQAAVSEMRADAAKAPTSVEKFGNNGDGK